jgi:hypothetical protein
MKAITLAKAWNISSSVIYLSKKHRKKSTFCSENLNTAVVPTQKEDNPVAVGHNSA